MKIGDLAKRAGCTVETIRYYEREGLLPNPERGANNYRLYNNNHLDVLCFIRNCRALEMTLAEIGFLLRTREQPGQDCGEVNTLLEEHIRHVKGRIVMLQQLEDQLISLRKLCHQIQPVTRCAIMRELADASEKIPGFRDSVETHVHGAH